MRDGLMDLDFVDPPLEPGMTPYDLAVDPDQAAEQLRIVAQELRSGDRLSVEAADLAGAALEDPEAASIYADQARFIARFLTIELDTENSIGKGIGRVHPSEPPPRFGDKFGRSLRRPGVKDEIFPLVDEYTFRGFATAVAANGLRKERYDLNLDTPIGDRWVRFMRHLFPTYGEFTKRPEASPVAGIRNIVCAPVDEAFADVLGRLAGPVRQFRRSRALTYTCLFPAVGWAAYYAASSETS
jgi:hypothetical protein